MFKLLKRFGGFLGTVLKEAVKTTEGIIVLVLFGILAIANPLLAFTLAIAIPLLVILILLAAYWLAAGDTFFTFVAEGTAKIIVQGESFDHAVMSFHGFHLNDPRKSWFQKEIDGKKVDAWDVLPNRWQDFYDNDPGLSDRDLANRYDDRNLLEKTLGAFWVGFPPIRKVKEYRFEWNELKADPAKGGEERSWSRAGITNFIYVADFTYVMVAHNLKTADRLAVNAMYLLTVGCTNPYKALFRVEEWLKRVGAATDRETRDYLGAREYNNLMSEETAPAEESTQPSQTTAAKKKRDSFSKPIEALSFQLFDEPDAPASARHGLAGLYGITIRAADLRRTTLTGDAEELNAKAEAEAYRAKQQAKAIKVVGKAEAKVIAMKGEKESLALQSRIDVISKSPDIGLALAKFDSIVDASKNPGGFVIHASDMGDGILGMAARAAVRAGQSPAPIPPASSENEVAS